MKKLSIIIPVFNEAATIQKILRFIAVLPLHWEKEVVVVDDGSTDGTSEILEKLFFAFGGRGRKIVYPQPSFSMYKHIDSTM